MFTNVKKVNLTNVWHLKGLDSAFNKLASNPFLTKLQLEKYTIKKRNLIGFFTLITLLIIISIVSLFSTFILANTTHKIYDIPYTVNHNVWAIKHSFGALEREMYQIVATGQSESIFEKTVTILNAISELETALQDYPEALPLLQDIKDPLNDLTPLRDDILNYTLAGDTDIALEILENDYKSTVSKAQMASDTLFSLSQTIADDFIKDTQVTYITIFIVIILLATFSILFAILLSFYITQSITGPLEKFKAVLMDFCDGNLKCELDYSANDEIGELGLHIKSCGKSLETYVNDISDQLHQLATGNLNIQMDTEYIGGFAPIKTSILHISDSLSHTLHSVKENCDTVHSTSIEVSSATQSLQSKATSQNELAENLVDTLTTLSTEIDQTATTASDVRSKTVQTAQLIEHGAGQLNDLNTSITSIVDTTQEIKKVIIKMDEFAQQIKLIALNAKLEAARLGENGKGFDVVATQMSHLSTQSSLAAKETSTLISACLQATDSGSLTVKETTAIFSEIFTSIQHFEGDIHNVFDASIHQADALRLSLGDVRKIQEVSQSFLSFTEKTSNVSETLLNESHSLEERLTQFRF